MPRFPYFYLELLNKSNQSAGFIDAMNHKVIRKEDAAKYAHEDNAKTAADTARTRWEPAGYTVLLVTKYNA